MFEILINKQEKQKEIALIENGKLIEYYLEDEKTYRNEGNIYLGIVKDDQEINEEIFQILLKLLKIK